VIPNCKSSNSRLGNGLGGQSCTQGQAQNEFAAACRNPLAKPCHEAWVDRQVVAEVLFAAEVLPVGVHYPAGHHIFGGDLAKHQKNYEIQLICDNLVKVTDTLSTQTKT
jgi:hypothetical protein